MWRFGRWESAFGVARTTRSAVPITTRAYRMTAMPDLRTGWQVGLWERKDGAAHTTSLDVHQSLILPLLCTDNMTATQGTATGGLDGRPTRNSGAVTGFTEGAQMHLTIAMPDILTGSLVGQHPRRRGAAITLIAAALCRCHMIATRGTATGNWVGLQAKNLGAARTATVAVGDPRMIAMLATRIGCPYGPLPRRNGAAITTIMAVLQRQFPTTATLASPIGGRGGRTVRKNGAANMLTEAARICPTTVMPVTPTGTMAGRMRRRSGAAIISIEAVRYQPTIAMLAMTIGRASGPTTKSIGAASTFRKAVPTGTVIKTTRTGCTNGVPRRSNTVASSTIVAARVTAPL